jgi:hypothetical protein
VPMTTINKGDPMSLKVITPTWQTNPTAVYFGGEVVIQ